MRTSNELSDKEIQVILKYHGIKINGIFMKDEFPKNPKVGFYIINLQSSTDGNGTHWCSLYYYPSMSIYFDAFGFVPPREIEDKIGKYMYNDRDIQNYNDTSCGYFCIAFLKFLNGRKNKYEFFHTFINMFNKDTKQNNRICELIINS